MHIKMKVAQSYSVCSIMPKPSYFPLGAKMYRSHSIYLGLKALEFAEKYGDKDADFFSLGQSRIGDRQRVVFKRRLVPVWVRGKGLMVEDDQ